MGNGETVRRLWELFAETRYRDTLPMLAPDFRAIWPVTREQIVDGESFIRLQEEYPGTFAFTVHDILEEGNTVISIVTVRWNDAQDFTAISRWRFNDASLIAELTEWWPDEAEPPAGREHLTRRY